MESPCIHSPDWSFSASACGTSSGTVTSPGFMVTVPNVTRPESLPAQKKKVWSPMGPTWTSTSPCGLVESLSTLAASRQPANPLAMSESSSFTSM